MYFPLRYYHRKHTFGDAHSYAQLTRFITPEVRMRFEDRTTANDTVEDGSYTAANAPDNVARMDAMLKDLWQA